MTLSHIQMLGVLGIFKAKGTATFNRIAGRPAEIAGGSFTSVLPIKCTLGSQAYGPFLLNMLLPILIPTLVVIFLVPMKIVEDLIRGRRRKRGKVPTFQGKWGLRKWMAPFKFCRRAITPNEVKAYLLPFEVVNRFAGVMVFVLFTIYPTLVSSVTSMMNCTAPIHGVRYLVADLEKTCYDSWHSGFLAIASFFAIVYCVGIPLAIGFAIVFKTPCVCRRDELEDDDDARMIEDSPPLHHFDDGDDASSVEGDSSGDVESGAADSESEAESEEDDGAAAGGHREGEGESSSDNASDEGGIESDDEGSDSNEPAVLRERPPKKFQWRCESRHAEDFKNSSVRASRAPPPPLPHPNTITPLLLLLSSCRYECVMAFYSLAMTRTAPVSLLRGRCSSCSRSSL